jgi:tyrosyl-tRNA synthetase
VDTSTSVLFAGLSRPVVELVSTTVPELARSQVMTMADDRTHDATADLLGELAARGLIQDTTDRAALAARLAEGPVTLYYGCDPTADSLHVGNLIGLLVLRRFQEAGHRVVALAGGATGMIGDPSGRSEERNLLDEATLSANVEAIKAQMERVLDFSADRAVLVDNREWTADVTLLSFLRDVGKHVTVNQMVARESVKARMASEHGISYTEFTYMLLQANDYLWLHDNRGVELQVGGSDQWGNMVSGVDLVRRVRGAATHALSWPLLTAPDGSKLGKTTGARVWLSAERTSPYRFFQHWMQTDDGQVKEFLAKFTLLPLEAVNRAMVEHENAPQERKAQRLLAREATGLVHGEAAAEAAEQASAVLFGGSVDDASAEALRLVAGEAPTSPLPPDEEMADGVEPVALLTATGLASSRSDARRGLEAGSFYLNGRRMDDATLVTSEDLRHERYVVLRKGKKQHAVLVRELS